MTIVRIAKHCTTLNFHVLEKSFFGIFRYGRSIFVQVKVCCDEKGKISWFVIDGPKNINYKKMFKKKFKEAEELVTDMWNDGRRQANDYHFRVKQLQEKIEASKSAKKLQPVTSGVYRRGIDGVVTKQPPPPSILYRKTHT